MYIMVVQNVKQMRKNQISYIPVPPALLRSYASPSIVAWVIYSKYVNGMPLNRQEKDWLQYGFELSRASNGELGYRMYR